MNQVLTFFVDANSCEGTPHQRTSDFASTHHFCEVPPIVQISAPWPLMTFGRETTTRHLQPPSQPRFAGPSRPYNGVIPVWQPAPLLPLSSAEHVILEAVAASADIPTRVRT